MKAVSLVTPREVAFVEIAEPELGPEDVLVDVRYVGLCGSDLNTYRGSFQLVEYPRIPGHEVSGIISAKGALVPEVIVEGANVVLAPYTECGFCYIPCHF